jgi:hypothetical protein
VSPRLGPVPAIADPARAALVAALRKLISDSRFDTLGEISDHIASRPGKRRLSELACGTGKFPEQHEVTALAEACDRGQQAEVLRLLHAAAAERSALQAAPPPGVGDLAVTGLVGQFRDWDALGVHRPITRLGSGNDLSGRVAAGELPAYVLRETDLDPDPVTGLRATLAEAAAGTGPPVRLVVITGESSAGKTRAAVEAMHAHLGAWRLLIPHGAASLARLLDQHPPLQHTVVWLDEIDRILGDHGGVEQVRRLLTVRDGPLVLLGTLRTDREAALRATPGWELLDRRAHRVPLKRRPPRAELERELERARELDDPWIAEALARMGTRYGIGEWLAAGPQLLRELDRARTSSDPIERVAATIVDAAIDCYRAGYTTPCPEPLLAEAHQLYLDDPNTPTPPATFTAALEWARRPIAGATGLLEHLRSGGDIAFDYLLGHADRPTAAPPPPEIWDILPRRVTPGTVETIAQAAHRHGQPHIAATLISRTEAHRQNELLALIGDADTLTTRADNGDEPAAWQLAELLVKRGDVDTLTSRADNGDSHAARKLAELLAERGDVDTLTARADNGDPRAAKLLAWQLAVRGDVDTLTARADNGDPHAAAMLARLLGHRRDLTALTARAGNGDPHAAEALARLLAKRGDPTALTTFLADNTEITDDPDDLAARELARLLAERGDVDTLTSRADKGDRPAARKLAELLAERGDVDTLTSRAGNGDRIAARELARLLVKRGDVDILTSRAGNGDLSAAWQLAELLAERGDVDILTSRAGNGDPHAEWRLDQLLAKRGDLTARADNGGPHAVAEVVARLLRRVRRAWARSSRRLRRRLRNG